MIVKQKPATENFRGWWGFIKQAGCLFIGYASKQTQLFQLNKTATDMGSSVAVAKLIQKDWLNCYAETRPWEVWLTSTDFELNIQRVSFL